jgi:hypothetical protein
LLTDELATTKKIKQKSEPENLAVFACFRGFFFSWVYFDLEERMRAFKGQIKANKAMFRRGGGWKVCFACFCCCVLQCRLATLSRFGVADRALRGLILTALVAKATKIATQQKLQRTFPPISTPVEDRYTEIYLRCKIRFQNTE